MDIIVTGSIAYDYLMRFPGKFSDNILPDQLQHVSLSFLVEDMTRHWGGNGGNIAYSLGLLRQRPRLFATGGRDFGDYRGWLESAGVDTSLVQQIDSVFMASFFANTDVENNLIASFYSGAMAYAKNYSIAQVTDRKPDMVIIPPNDPLAMINLTAECRERAIPFIFDPGQQLPRLSADDLREGMRGAFALIVNFYEYEQISQKTGLSMEQMRAQVDTLIITRGGEGSRIYTKGADTPIEIPIFPLDSMGDPIGGGDAYRSGLLSGWAMGYDWTLCGEMGALCATYVLEQTGPQTHRYTVPEYVQRFRSRFDDGGALDSLLALS